MWTWTSTRARLDKLQADFEAFKIALEALERQPKLLRNEWEDTLDRINRVMGRLNARIKAASAPENEQLPEGDTQSSPPAQRQTGTHDRLRAFRARRQS